MIGLLKKLLPEKYIWLCTQCNHPSNNVKIKKTVSTLPFLVHGNEINGMKMDYNCTDCECKQHHNSQKTILKR